MIVYEHGTTFQEVSAMKYTGNALNEISFPLGGIGTGSIGLAGNGRFVDWEIFNRPNKGSINGYSHIAVKATGNGVHACKVLNGDLTKGFMGDATGNIGYGPARTTMCSFPHFRNCTFEGEYPVANIDFSDPDFPGTVRLTAFNPLIPLEADDSSIPAAFFEIRFSNDTAEVMDYEAIFSLANPFKLSRNTEFHQENVDGILLEYPGISPDSKEFGQLCLACEQASTVQPYWFRGKWLDNIVMFWNEFTSDAGLSHRVYDTDGAQDTCSLGKCLTLNPGESGILRFIVSWNIPNNYRYWAKSYVWNTGMEDPNQRSWKNYYATRFDSAAASAIYSLENFDTLQKKTLAYKETLFASTVDPVILDAVSATVSVLKSPTVFRLENGEFYGFEGSNKDSGSCEGTCQHVYNYAYALCFLFPELERSIRNLEFDHCTWEDGSTAFRLALPLRAPEKPLRACLDGQMGCVFKTYREWKISGDNEWLKKVWPTVKKILAYAWSEENADAWDRNKDGVLEGRQHHTLDMELFGPSSWLEGFYLAALKAAEEMALFLGDPEAAEYRRLFESGKQWTKENLFNGKYFFHAVDLNDKSIMDRFNCADDYWNEETGEIKYQIGQGSEIDQLCGQWHANILGLGQLFDKEQVHIALENMLKNNFKDSMRSFANPWRVFALNDEAGTVICDYPEGAYKPKIPVPYCEESMHGFEYQFAGLLMSEGFIEDGIKVVRAVRDRYQGFNRNPWNEMECGNNYVRSMASFALLPILSGFTFDLPKGIIGFDPKVNQNNFRCLWSLGTGWGSVAITNRNTTVVLNAGSLTLSALRLPYIQVPVKLYLDGKETDCRMENGTLGFDRTTITKSIEVRYES